MLHYLGGILSILLILWAALGILLDPAFDERNKK